MEDGDVRYSLDVSKIRNELGWCPQFHGDGKDDSVVRRKSMEKMPLDYKDRLCQ